MRAREFTINIPINIVIDSNGDPTVKTDPVDDDTGTFIPPLQQKIELLKKSTGVKSAFDSEDDAELEDNQTHPSPFDAQADDDEPLE